MKHNTWQCNTWQCNTLQCNTFHYIKEQYNVQCKKIQYTSCNTMQFNTMRYNAMQKCITLQCNTIQNNTTQDNKMQCEPFQKCKCTSYSLINILYLPIMFSSKSCMSYPHNTSFHRKPRKEKSMILRNWVSVGKLWKELFSEKSFSQRKGLYLSVGGLFISQSFDIRRTISSKRVEDNKFTQKMLKWYCEGIEQWRQYVIMTSIVIYDATMVISTNFLYWETIIWKRNMPFQCTGKIDGKTLLQINKFT